MTTDREEATGVTFLGATDCFSVTALLLDGVAVSSLFIVAWWCGEAGGCKCFLEVWCVEIIISAGFNRVMSLYLFLLAGFPCRVSERSSVDREK